MIGIISRTEGVGGGAEVILCHLLSNWTGRQNLVVITAKDSSVAHVAKENGIRVIELAFISYKLFANIKLVEESLPLLNGMKLIHAWNSKSFEIGWYISKRKRLPLTCTLHDHPRSSYYTSKKLKLLRFVANSSNYTVSVSDCLKAECRKNKYRENIVVIRNGLPDTLSETVKIKNDKIRIGFLGMNVPLKGFNLIYDWILQMKDNRMIEWRLFGSVCMQNKELLTKLKRENVVNITVYGHKLPEEIFSEIDIVVNASTGFDCLPTVLIEALRAGVPAIASAKGGANEIVKHGLDGFIFNPETPEEGLTYLKQIISDQTLFRRMSEHARRNFVNNFQVQQMVEEYALLWQKEMKN